MLKRRGDGINTSETTTPRTRSMEGDSEEQAEEPSGAELLLSGALHFPLSWAKPQQKQDQQTVLPAPLQQAGQGKKQILAKESSFANSFLLQLKCSCPKAKHILIMMWDLLVTKALATGCQVPGFVWFFCNFFCARTNSIQPPFPDERKGSTSR